MALLVLAQELELLRIEEAGVRIERPGHAGDRTFIDRLVGSDLIGEILFDDAENFVKARRLCLISSSDVAADAPRCWDHTSPPTSSRQK